MAYEDLYREKAKELAGNKPGDLISVFLNEQAVVGSKLQFCARLPGHTDVSPYQSRTELDEEYDRRTAGEEFRRIEQIGLLGHLPKFSAQGLHHPIINPDLRLRLIEVSKSPWAPFNVAGVSDTDDTEALDVSLGQELEIFDWMEMIGSDAAEAMIWYVGRAIDRDELPYEDSGGFSDFGLRTLLFGQIAIFLEGWKTADPELTFSEFAKRNGDVHDGYHIEGTFDANSLELKSREDLDIDVPVETALEDWLRAMLVSFLKYSLFEPSDIDEEAVRAGNVRPGDGELEYDDLTPAQTGAYEDASASDIDDWQTYQFVDRLSIDVDIQPTKIEFELDLPAIN